MNTQYKSKFLQELGNIFNEIELVYILKQYRDPDVLLTSQNKLARFYIYTGETKTIYDGNIGDPQHCSIYRTFGDKFIVFDTFCGNLPENPVYKIIDINGTILKTVDYNMLAVKVVYGDKFIITSENKLQLYENYNLIKSISLQGLIISVREYIDKLIVECRGIIYVLDKDLDLIHQYGSNGSIKINKNELIHMLGNDIIILDLNNGKCIDIISNALNIRDYICVDDKIVICTNIAIKIWCRVMNKFINIMAISNSKIIKVCGTWAIIYNNDIVVYWDFMDNKFTELYVIEFGDIINIEYDKLVIIKKQTTIIILDLYDLNSVRANSIKFVLPDRFSYHSLIY